MYKISLLIIFLILGYSGSAQEQFNLKIKFPAGLDINKLDIFLDNGKTQKPVKKTRIEGDTIMLSGTYYSKYATIVLRYPQYAHLNYQNMFFIKTDPATITFYKSGKKESPFEQYTLNNAYDLVHDKSKMKAFDSVEVNNLNRFIKKYGDHIFSHKDTMLTQQFIHLNKSLFMRDLNYIINNGDSYYSFLFFRRNMIHSQMLSADSALSIFKNTFPDKFKNSIEGNTILKTLKGRMNAKVDKPAPNFTAKTIKGESLSLKKFRGKKYVLLIFWTNWCIPCIKELPIFKEIRKTYSRKKLAMISIAYKGNYSKYLELVKEYNMNWLNIYNDVDVINAYGGHLPIPRVYLISRSGKIIFDLSKTPSLSTLQKRLYRLLNKQPGK